MVDIRYARTGAGLAVIGLVLAALPVDLGRAQSTAQVSTTAPTEGGLQEIIVTARKRTESAQDVPVALTAISAETVEEFDLTSLEKLAASTPEFSVGRASNGSGAEITLRGIGSQSTSIGLENSTAIVVDGVYYGQGRVINEAFLDLAGIELLKGPQALFFGKNATAGVINITTEDPTPQWSSMARAGYEFEAEEPMFEGFVSGPVTDTLSFRLTARVSDMRGDLFHNMAVPTPIDTTDLATGVTTTRIQEPSNGPFPGTEDGTVRGTIKWAPIDRFTFTLKGGLNIANDSSNAGNYVPIACANPNGMTQTNPLVHCAQNFNIYQPDAPSGFGGNVPGLRDDGQPYNRYKSTTVTATLAYTADPFTVTSINNYNWNRNLWGLGFNIESPTSYTASHEDTTYWSWSSENRLQTKFNGPVNGMIGVYYQQSKRLYSQDGNFVQLTDSAAPPPYQYLTYLKNSQTDGRTVAGFGELTWTIIPTVELSGGARYTHETKDSYLDQPYIISALQSLFVQYNPADPAATVVSANQKWINWSPEATIRYKPSESLMFYTAYKTAYKSGGFSNSAFVIAGAPASNIAFNPETVHGFETGMKSTLLDNQLRFNVDVYTYTYDHLQVDYFNSINFQFITTNAGSARVRGVETETEYAPHWLPGLDLQGSLNYNKARYQNYIAPCYGGESIQAGCDTTFLGGPGQNLSGAPTAVAPDVTASLGGSYDMPISASLKLGIAADGRFSSGYYGSSFGEPLSRMGSYVVLDANVHVRTSDDRWELAVLARNLTDRFYISGVLDAPNSGVGTGTAHATPADILGLANDPRTVRLQLTGRF